jgi:hypothetical protein
VAGGFAGVLMQPGPMGQCLGEQPPIPDREAEALGEDVGPTHVPELTCVAPAGRSC